MLTSTRVEGEVERQTPRIRQMSSSIGLRAVGCLESEVEAWIAHSVAVDRDHNSAQ